MPALIAISINLILTLQLGQKQSVTKMAIHMSFQPLKNSNYEHTIKNSPK